MGYHYSLLLLVAVVTTTTTSTTSAVRTRLTKPCTMKLFPEKVEASAYNLQSGQVYLIYMNFTSQEIVFTDRDNDVVHFLDYKNKKVMQTPFFYNYNNTCWVANMDKSLKMFVLDPDVDTSKAHWFDEEGLRTDLFVSQDEKYRLEIKEGRYSKNGECGSAVGDLFHIMPGVSIATTYNYFVEGFLPGSIPNEYRHRCSMKPFDISHKYYIHTNCANTNKTTNQNTV